MGHGIRAKAGLGVGKNTASMGPCLWGTEYGRSGAAGHWSHRSFNGAVPLGHGIPQYTGELPLGLDGFNGAVPLGHGIPINNQVGVVM